MKKCIDLWKKIAYGEGAKKSKKKTNNSTFSATHTYIKLTLVSFFFTFFHAPFPKQPFSCVLLYFRDHEAFVLTYINQAQLASAWSGDKRLFQRIGDKVGSTSKPCCRWSLNSAQTCSRGSKNAENLNKYCANSMRCPPCQYDETIINAWLNIWMHCKMQETFPANMLQWVWMSVCYGAMSRGQSHLVKWHLPLNTKDLGN